MSTDTLNTQEEKDVTEILKRLLKALITEQVDQKLPGLALESEEKAGHA